MKFFALFALATALPFLPGETTSNEYVAVKFTVKQKEFASGDTGSLFISFKPKKGIHVTTDPPFKFAFDTLKQFFSTGKADFAKDSKEYLNTQQPVKQKFLIAQRTPPGTYRLKGTLVYYYCSDKEGWCSRFRQPVEMSLMVR